MNELPVINFENLIFRKEISFPEKLSSELAEEIGIHIGDGSLVLRKKEGHYDYFVCLSTEEESYKNHVIKLIKKIYGILPSRIDIDKNSVNIEYSSKLLLLWKSSMGLPIGNKKDITIPEIISSSVFITDCLRGIFDTDGSVTFKKKGHNYHTYPVLKIDNKNYRLIVQINSILRNIGITSSFQLNRPRISSNGSKSFVSTIYVSGKSNTVKWFKLISPKNEIHITKYHLWKKFGFCPPKTTLEERKLMLNGKMNPRTFYAEGGI